MKYVSCEVMRELDRKAIEEFGIPGIVLMENAALRFFDELTAFTGDPKGKKAVIVCGSGNNGGDGFAVARHLANAGAHPEILYTGSLDKTDSSSDAGINAGTAVKMGIPILENAVGNIDVCAEKISGADIVIDAVFGTGLARSVEGTYAELLDALSSGSTIICVDIPSGLNGDTGFPMGTAVQADMTVTFGAAKQGFENEASREYTGIVKVVDISIPSQLFRD